VLAEPVRVAACLVLAVAVLLGPVALGAHLAHAQDDEGYEDDQGYDDGGQYAADTAPDPGSYGEALDPYGSWIDDDQYGRAWQPAVNVDWAPYTDGYWAWTPYGWTWVSSEPWGWTFHYGRWAFVGGFWGWCPGPFFAEPFFAPALVGFVGGPRFFFGFGFPFVVDPFFYYPYAYPYYAPYSGYGYEYPPPPPPEEPGYEAGQEPQYGAQSEAPPEETQPTPEDAERASYGLVQLRGVPDGASVDLDGRFWMKAERLENRWVALPRGPHTITVHVEGREPAEQQVDVEPGKTRVVRFTLGRHRA